MVTIAEAARQLGVTDRTIRNWISEGRLKAYRIGPRLIRVEADSIAALARPLAA